MKIEPTPRMLVLDLYRLSKEGNAAHEDVISAIIRNENDITPYEQRREEIRESQEEIRKRLRQHP